MRRIQKTAAIVISILVIFAAYGFWETRQPVGTGVSKGNEKAKSDNSGTVSLVDQSPLKTAQQLAQLATMPEEKPLAQEALRLADFLVDLTFDSALREALLHPPALTPETKEITDRLQKTEKILKADQDRAKQLAELLGKAPESKQEGLEVDLVQAEL